MDLLSCDKNCPTKKSNHHSYSTYRKIPLLENQIKQLLSSCVLSILVMKRKQYKKQKKKEDNQYKTDPKNRKRKTNKLREA